MKLSFGKIRDKECICPYCMGPFNLEDVHFRTSTSYSGEEVKRVEEENKNPSLDSMPESNGKKQMARKYQENDDEIFLEFWKPFRKRRKVENLKHPVVTPEKVDAMRIKVLTDDEDGLPCGVIDYGKEESHVRLCPLCHNELPLKYGKYPVIFLTVIGISQELLTKYYDKLSDTLMKVPEIVSGDSAEDYEENENGAGSLFEPLIFDFADNNRHYTLVFHGMVPDGPEGGSNQFGIQCIGQSNIILFLLDADDMAGALNGDVQIIERMDRMVDTAVEACQKSDPQNGESGKKRQCILQIAIVKDWNNYEWLQEEKTEENLGIDLKHIIEYGVEKRQQNEQLVQICNKMKSTFEKIRVFQCKEEDGSNCGVSEGILWALPQKSKKSFWKRITL